MSDKIVKLRPAEVGSDFRFDPDEVLETAKGGNFRTLMVIAEYEDGGLYITGNANTGEMVVLLEQIKHKLIFGEGEE